MSLDNVGSEDDDLGSRSKRANTIYRVLSTFLGLIKFVIAITQRRKV